MEDKYEINSLLHSYEILAIVWGRLSLAQVASNSPVHHCTGVVYLAGNLRFSADLLS